MQNSSNPNSAGLSKPPKRFLKKGVFELANKAHFLYLTRNSAERGQLLKSVLLNCATDGVSLSPTYRKPFDLIFERAKTENWSGREDLNLVPNYESTNSKCFIWCRLGTSKPTFLSLRCTEAVPRNRRLVGELAETRQPPQRRSVPTPFHFERMMYKPLPPTLFSGTKPNSGIRLSLLTSRLSPATNSSPGGISMGPNSFSPTGAFPWCWT